MAAGSSRGSGAAKASPALLSFIAPQTPDEVIARYASLPLRAQAADFGIFDHNVVILDTETTGFSFNHDELLQIAAARMENGEVVDRFTTFVDPGRPIPESISYLTNIHDEDVSGAPSPEEALEQLVSFVGDAMIVAHNVEFDFNFTTKHPAGYPLLENTWIDSLDLARIALPRMKSHRLVDLVHAFEAPLSSHRADEDVEATCALFRILLAAVEAMPAPLLEEIAGMATPQQWPTSIVFSYFAHRGAQTGGENASANAQAGGGDASTIAGAEQDAGSSPASATTPSQQGAARRQRAFSLRDIRRNRVGDVVWEAKRGDLADDAAYLNLQFPSEKEICEAFSPSGLVGLLYDDYETRTEQLAMAKAVRRAFATSTNLMVEAGTGVGKSMAYLVPAALTARANNMPVGIATKTNALLDQLVNHELPALADALAAADSFTGEKPDPLSFAALKGFSHYICLHKVEELVAEASQEEKKDDDENPQAPALAALLSFIEQTRYGDIDDLKIDYRSVPRRLITTTGNDCLRHKCPYYGASCFVHGARRNAETADIIVTNHSLLFCDLAAERRLLPPVRFWIVDEAHGAEDEARNVFSLELDIDEIKGLVQQASCGESARSVFAHAEKEVSAYIAREVATKGEEDAATQSQSEGFSACMAKAKAASRAFALAEEEFAAQVHGLLAFDTSKKRRGYEYVDLWINEDIRGSSAFCKLAEQGHVMADCAEELVGIAQETIGCLQEMDVGELSQREIASLALNLEDMIHAVEVILLDAPPIYVYAAHLCSKAEKGGDRLEALLYDVGETMNESLYASTHSVVFTSATLTVEGSFDATSSALGLNSSEQSQCDLLELGSSFDFDNNMKVYVVNDIPEPNSPAYLPRLQKLLIDVHIAQHGSMLTLFTNRNEMEKSYDVVQPALQKAGLRLVCQKWGISTKGLRDDFLKDESLSLFALRSFWEGFDAPGSTLRGVVIPKLPFSKPTDPLSRERAARDEHAWLHYVLPAAVIETKQAAGRLIRKADDEGVLILADSRLTTKSYGTTFLRSLPSKNICVCSCAEIVEDIRRRCSSL